MNTDHPSLRLALALALLAPVAACGDDSSGDDEAADATDESTDTDAGETEADPFADCSAELLAGDFGVADTQGNPGAPRWYGPGADENGALIDDGASEYVVSSTYLALSADADLAMFSELNVANSMTLFANPGLVAAQLGGSAECGSARTFVVWESQAAMMAFVTSDAHVASIVAFPSLSRGGSILSVWPEAVPVSEITWEAALERLADSQAYD
ncbi:hypothetical protein PPSIR1_15665 [Plesiocystis pacifica SIR-1]|uniref:Uncharacterized protein n=1 Tax=Plesiocystis pacifica SIR-1 TaxID=391625 RepID=A6GHA1_9BACT|nr:hypothetical protein [Plesiocystis pacifica]EDM74770.1 hypothetical protein PPSIR1_15665 [Plesiocystis pacifica SIR-1]